MIESSNARPEPGSAAEARPTAAEAPTHPLFWSVRRELWENRSLYIVPLIAAAVALAGYVFYALKHLTQQVLGLSAVEPARRHAIIAAPFDFVAIALIIASLIVAAYYCLEALHGERRDRSILFWKSMPVSDLATVASKAAIPLLVLPVIAFAAVIVTHVVMLLFGTLVLLFGQASASVPWTEVRLFSGSGILAYGLVTLAIWHAPIYAWLMLVSAWAQRAPFLWAVVPPALIALVEKLAIGTSYFWSMLKFRLNGGFAEAFTVPEWAHSAPRAGAGGHMSPEQFAEVLNPIPDPVKFLSSPWVWVGLAVAAALFALAVWVRRRRDPI
jgi:ABC-2 type transport system permease protein